MKKKFEFEGLQLKKHRWILLISAFLSQLSSLYFFTIIGRVDSTEANGVLKNYITLSGLASTISMCILVVYGTVIINRFLVTNYISENKTRLYVYPIGRSRLFYTKIASFCGVFSLFQFLGIAVSNAIYLVIETFTPILLTSESASKYFIPFMITALATVMLTISVIILSSLVGIYFNSTVTTIVTGIIFVVIFGNILAMAFASNVVITLGASILVALVTSIFVKITGMRIENDEVISK